MSYVMVIEAQSEREPSYHLMCWKYKKALYNMLLYGNDVHIYRHATLPHAWDGESFFATVAPHRVLTSFSSCCGIFLIMFSALSPPTSKLFPKLITRGDFLTSLEKSENFCARKEFKMSIRSPQITVQ